MVTVTASNLTRTRRGPDNFLRILYIKHEYEVSGRTDADIAKELGISRQMVNQARHVELKEWMSNHYSELVKEFPTMTERQQELVDTIVRTNARLLQEMQDVVERGIEVQNQ